VLSYCFSWTPLVILMSVVLLSLPWLGLIALFVLSLFVLGLLATLAWTVIWVPRTLSLAVCNRYLAASTVRVNVAVTSGCSLTCTL